MKDKYPVKRTLHVTGYHTLHHNIPLRHRDRQLPECLHIPYSEEGGYRKDGIPLYELWISSQMVRYDPGVQFSCTAGEMSQM